MPPSSISSATPRPRVLLYSARRIEIPVWHAAQHEFEDVIAEVDDVTVVAPKARWRSTGELIRFRLANRALRRLGRPVQELPIPMEPVRGEYDVFFGVFHNVDDAAYLSRMPGWRERSRWAACFVVEMWSREAPGLRPYLELLREFDHIFTFNAANANVIARETGRPVTFLPMAVDARRFSPYPALPRRAVDVYALGRRSAPIHEQLTALAERDRLFYLYDTSTSGLIGDYRDHRRLFASYVKRSRYFFAHSINTDPARRERTGGEEGLSTRYFEGAAGGAVLLGSRAGCPEWEQCFGWKDALIDFPFEADDVAARLAALDAEPARLAAIGRRNAVESLRRHDWGARWTAVLAAAGLPETERARARRLALEAVAAAAESAPLDPASYLPSRVSSYLTPVRSSLSIDGPALQPVS